MSLEVIIHIITYSSDLNENDKWEWVGVVTRRISIRNHTTKLAAFQIWFQEHICAARTFTLVAPNELGGRIELITFLSCCGLWRVFPLHHSRVKANQDRRTRRDRCSPTAAASWAFNWQLMMTTMTGDTQHHLCLLKEKGVEIKMKSYLVALKYSEITRHFLNVCFGNKKIIFFPSFLPPASTYSYFQTMQ